MKRDETERRSTGVNPVGEVRELMLACGVPASQIALPAGSRAAVSAPAVTHSVTDDRHAVHPKRRAVGESVMSLNANIVFTVVFTDASLRQEKGNTRSVANGSKSAGIGVFFSREKDRARSFHAKFSDSGRSVTSYRAEVAAVLAAVQQITAADGDVVVFTDCLRAMNALHANELAKLQKRGWKQSPGDGGVVELLQAVHKIRTGRAGRVSIAWIPRELNEEANALARHRSGEPTHWV
jgi:ribonuclease HI